MLKNSIRRKISKTKINIRTKKFVIPQRYYKLLNIWFVILCNLLIFKTNYVSLYKK